MTTTTRPIGTEFEVILRDEPHQTIMQVWRVIGHSLIDGRMVEVAIPSHITYQPKGTRPLGVGGQEKKA